MRGEVADGDAGPAAERPADGAAGRAYGRFPEHGVHVERRAVDGELFPQLSFAFNYLGPTGNQRDEVTMIRRRSQEVSY